MSNITQGSLNGFISETQNQFFNLLNREMKFDKEVDSWLFMSTPWPVFSILAVYLFFVLIYGPKMMKKREPFNIKTIMMAYNFIQTVYNCYIVSAMFITPGVSDYLKNYVCHPDETENSSLLIRQFYSYSWHFFLSKVFDLLDTVFFVLRKKQSHVSFLHVYHHVNMVITTWTYLRFFKGQQAILCGALNSTVHMIMYSYYFLSALGPHMQKYLWWKKYLTRLQIFQFIIGLTFAVSLFFYDCSFPRVFAVYMIADVTLFLYLFVLFYKKTYSEKTKSG
ncbi:elongation of very long chain fatty acids protein 4-like [Adelges cooleyi]|uniref:elongation of very long chain fatty acids protein 4-like n=1 Tax=Adelges cooleyi TaxID=133065 RepID=UPI00217FA57A|nr:elongation of very long chain fatty acids protein 4-like [Adelges cooleyi]XP_050440917.1 elongation of very long chain fatty acids protein 4-like [Adelges cooleyi]